MAANASAPSKRCAAPARLALLRESMGEGVVGVAGDGRCTFVNPAGAALLGWRSADVVGHDVAALLDGADGRVAAALARSAATRAEHALWRRGDGAVAALSCMVSPLAPDDQAGAVIVFRAGVTRAGDAGPRARAA